MPKQIDTKSATQLTVKNKGGRPTKYNTGLIVKVEEYFKTVGREQTELPSVEGMAEYLDISKETLYQWGKKHNEFSDAIKRVAQKQKKQLMDDGMYGGKEVNAAMAIFLLKVNHGMGQQEPTNLKRRIVAEEFFGD